MPQKEKSKKGDEVQLLEALISELDVCLVLDWPS